MSGSTDARSLERVRASLGPVAVIHWNAFSSLAGDLLTADAAAIRGAFDIAVTSLVAVVQAALLDLRRAESPALLVTNGSFAKLDAQVDAMGVQWSAMGLSVACAAKDKLVGLLSAKLAADGIYVGQVMVNGIVKGSAFDTSNDAHDAIDPRVIADNFWSLYRARADVRSQVG